MTRLVLSLITVCAASALSFCALPDFDAWDRVVKANVHAGSRDGVMEHLVDYASIAKDNDFG